MPPCVDGITGSFRLFLKAMENNLAPMYSRLRLLRALCSKVTLGKIGAVPETKLTKAAAFAMNRPHQRDFNWLYNQAE